MMNTLAKMAAQNIRNFCIIAHIDHGKSTLADRLMAETGAMSEREMTRTQMLDTMALEQERGITIKLQPVRMIWQLSDVRRQKLDSTNSQDQKIIASENFVLNLIDTPGHADFSYEVSRSLAACEGALLVVDASQGIEAQTLANVYSAMEYDLHILPVLNKIDLPAADPERVAEEMVKTFGFKKEEILQVSAKSGLGVVALLDEICIRIPPPRTLNITKS